MINPNHSTGWLTICRLNTDRGLNQTSFFRARTYWTIPIARLGRIRLIPSEFSIPQSAPRLVSPAMVVINQRLGGHMSPYVTIKMNAIVAPSLAESTFFGEFPQAGQPQQFSGHFELKLGSNFESSHVLTLR